MSDFLSGGKDALGGEIDLELAASTFPDISLDGSDNIHELAPTQVSTNKTGFSWDDFDKKDPIVPVKVTGDDVIEKFEDQFPDIDIPNVRQVSSYVLLHLGFKLNYLRHILLLRHLSSHHTTHRQLLHLVQSLQRMLQPPFSTSRSKKTSPKS